MNWVNDWRLFGKVLYVDEGFGEALWVKINLDGRKLLKRLKITQITPTKSKKL